MSIDRKQRSQESEWLDQGDLHPTELEHVLRDLARFNQTFFGHYPLLRWLEKALSSQSSAAPTLVDVGCGYGDLLRAIRRWARRRGLNIALLGIDLNRETIRIARAATDSTDQIDFQVGNAFDLASAAPVDFMISSLVTHHLSDREIAEFLRLIERAARRGWAICDLQRSRFLYHFIGLSGRLGRLHPMVVQDGQISVARSLTRTEWTQRIADAEIPQTKISIGWFLFRFLIGRLR